MFCFYLCNKINNKILMNKEISPEMTAVDLRDYYHSLRKKDKTTLLSYLCSNYGFRTSTLVNKFAARLPFSKADIALINIAIHNIST